MGALDEAIQRIFQRPKPEALIHQISPLHLQLALGAQHIGSEGQALQFLVGLNQQQQARGFVDLAALDAHHPVFDHVEAAKAMAAGQAIGFADQADRIQALAIDAHR